KITVIGVHSAKFANERDTGNIRNAILRYGIHHPVVNDFDFKIWQGFGVHAWPTFILINPNGMIENMYSGEGNRDAVAADIETLIKKYDGKINTSPLPIALEKDKTAPTVLRFPGKLAYTADFNGKPALFVSDSGHNRIVVTAIDGKIIETIGSGKTGHEDGAFDTASFNTPQGIIYSKGILYIADTNNHELRAADFKTRMVTTLAGTGRQGSDRGVKNAPALSTALSSPWDLAFYPDDKHIAVAMAGTHQLWSYDVAGQTVGVIAGNGRESIDDGRYPYNSLSQPSGLSASGGTLYFVDAETSSLREFENGGVRTLIGTGLFDFGYREGKQGTALMQHPLGLYADAVEVYVADAYNHSIRRYDVKTGALSNFAGRGVRGDKDGALEQAEFNEPNDVLKIGDTIYVADTNNNAIRVINLKTKTVSTLAVSEAAAAPQFSGSLPNLEKTGAMTVAPDAAVHLALKSGWHINADAPSALVLFDSARKAVASFDREALVRKSVALPNLKSGDYRLQGTLYYCEDKAGSQCLLKSFDIPVQVKAGGKSEVVLGLN
ncbi:MAG: hypothetical protein KGJ21_10465, partial [Pseudomonadota bacterium]|nr:hypothetical protein [Pseudomonadota bacterium]